MALTKYGIVKQLQSELGFPKKESVDTVESLLEIDPAMKWWTLG